MIEPRSRSTGGMAYSPNGTSIRVHARRYSDAQNGRLTTPPLVISAARFLLVRDLAHSASSHCCRNLEDRHRFPGWDDQVDICGKTPVIAE